MSSIRRALVGLAAFLSSIHGCAARDAAEVVVVVSSDLTVPAELDALEIRLRDSGGAVVEERAVPLSGSGEGGIVGSFGIVPLDGDLSRPVDVEVGALHASARLFTTRLRTRFLSNQRLRLDVFLARSCVEARCPETTMCLRGSCQDVVDIPPETLPVYVGPGGGGDGGPSDTGDATAPDAGDAGSDGGVPSDSGPDGGGDGGADAGPDAGIPACTFDDLFRVARSEGRDFGDLAMISTGTEYGLAWSGYDPMSQRIDLFFARVAEDAFARIDSGEFHLESTHTGTTAALRRARMTWTGSEYFVAFADTQDVPTQQAEIRFARVAPPETSPTAVGALTDTLDLYEDEVSVAFDGSDLGVVWRTDYSAGVFMKVSPTGERRIPEVDLGVLSTTSLVHLDATNQWLTVFPRWEEGDKYDLYSQALTSDGNFVTLVPRQLTFPAIASMAPDLILGPSELGLTWLDGRGPDLWNVAFARLDEAGVMLGDPVIVDRPTEIYEGPSLAWRDGSGYVLALRDQSRLRLVRVSPDGASSAAQEVPTREPVSSRPVIVSGPSGLVLAWTDSSGINLVRATCP